jgi:hypothetical protein
MRLSENKYWNNFSNNLALPLFEGYSLLSGGYTLLSGVKEGISALRYFTLRREITLEVQGTLAKAFNTVTSMDQKAILGYRGSLATGQKHSGGLFDPGDFDVDAFIISDKLAAQLGNPRFRNARNFKSMKNLSNTIEDIFKNLPGYRVDPTKPFTFRVFTEQEYKEKIRHLGSILITR